MKFGNNLYLEAYLDHKMENAKKESKKDLVKRVCDGCKSFIVNYNPFVGYLPIETQQNLKDKSKGIFRFLNKETAVLSSAIGLGLGAYFVGQYLDGFDTGFEIMQKVRFGGWGGPIGEVPKYISFPFIWGGFSQTFTHIASYFLIAESAIRTGAALLGKPLGGLIGETISYFIGKKSKSSKCMKEKEKEILREQKQIDYAEEFIEKKRRESENILAETTRQKWEKKTQLKLESLVNGKEQ